VPELLLELLTEEIPARMQARAAEDLCRLLGAALAPIAAGAPRGFSGPRRIGLVMEVAARAETAAKEERGPRVAAPEAALAGFLKKHGVGREALTQAGDFWVLVKPGSSIEAAALVAQALPDVLWSFPWPKSMRWGVSGFTWVRPLQRILCLLDGVVVPFALARGEDAAHGLASGDVTEGHRVHAPGAFAVAGYADYVARLREHCVLVDTAERAAVIRDGVAALAAAEGLEVVPDEGLLAEVAGLVEWPVPLLGGIDAAFMDLPAEVMRTSMRVNQRYFALRYPDGRPAPRFALVANISASDGGAALVAGNERVLRARLSDARFFWDQDLKTPLEDLLPKLDGVVFHAKLGTQGQRVRRLERLAAHIAPMVGAEPALAARAARLAKADLASGMVGEFPELQGIMGGYYARAGGEDATVADAVAQHYRPLGPTDAVPDAPVAVAVALADKLDQLAGFFAADERPTGSSDPFALRRAMLGIIRIITAGGLRLELKRAFALALEPFEALIRGEGGAGGFDAFMAKRDELVAFLVDRLRVQLRETGLAAGVITAVAHPGAVAEPDTDITRVINRANLLREFIATPQGEAMLGAYRRATNILRSEEKKQALEPGEVEERLFREPAETQLHHALGTVSSFDFIARDDYLAALNHLGAIRSPVDAFFEHVLVNDPDEKLRKNRLRLLSRLKSAMESVADLQRIEA
jgi:glycyl-tRNA synthetase beta chain